MLFNSWQYAVFLPIVFAIYWLVPHRFRWFVLLTASYYFYMSWNARYVVLILFTTVVSYSAALLMEKQTEKGAKKLILAAAAVCMLGLLAVFKYFGFFFDSLSAVLSVFSIRLHPVTLRLLLPVGISFYTFQTLSYVVDVYRGDCRAERHFGIYATFVSFFPQLVAGPIERTNNLLPQLKQEKSFSAVQGLDGSRLLLWGLFKKIVIADNFAVYADLVFDNIYENRGFALVLGALFFTIQIYGDFSGYSDIARGSAKLLGVELMENFRGPYFSTTIREFWSRWHISLSTWFRDYVYIPLGGNRVRRGRHYLNLLITFLASGLWHGASWTFVIWGGIHGLLQIAENLLGIRSMPYDRKHVLRWLLRCVPVFVLAALAWVFFRAQTLGEALYFFSGMFYGIEHPLQYLYGGFSGEYGLGLSIPTVLFGVIFLLGPLAIYDYTTVRCGKDASLVLAEKNRLLVWAVYLLLGAAIVILAPKGVAAAFVYFQF